jgi:CubicO group peptidase (beta-lactamase class C family)
VYEIGSITKTFTTTLLADMFLRGVFADDTVSHHLPDNLVTIPSLDGIEITFGHLATHTSGIPKAPHEDNSSFPLPPDYYLYTPYKCYTTEHIYDYLTNYCILDFTPGTWWEYSNTGMGLLGHTLGLIDGTSYESILTRYLFDVLGMDNSSIYLTQQQENNLALSHNSDYEHGYYFIANDIYQGAGSIKSSLNDMFKYLEAQMGITGTTLGNAINLTHQPQMHQGSLGDQGLAWFILELDDGQVITYHGGDTYGYSAFIGFNESLSTGVIVLLNYCLNGMQLIMGQDILKAINKY